SVSIAGGEAQRARGDLVSGNFFATLAVRPAIGRVLRDDDDGEPGANAVVVVSDAFWSRALGADSGVVGRTLFIDGTPFRIVGVAPPGFAGARAGAGADLWVPLSMQPQAMPRLSAGILDDRAAGWILVFGRLRDGVTIEAARAELRTIAAQLAQTYPVTNSGRSVGAYGGVGLYPDERDEVSGVLRLLLGAVGLVLLVACANVTSLLLVRLASRQREMATRLALGASRSRLIVQALMEGAALSIPGGALGLLVARAIARLATATQPSSSILRGIDVSSDGRVLLFALGASLLSGLLVAVMPAIHASHVAPMSAMKEGGRGFAPRRSPLQQALVAGQVALSLVALATAAMFLRGLFSVVNSPAGFDTGSAAMVSVDLGNQGYTAERGAVFLDEALRRLRAAPGVSAASVATTVPPNDYTGGTSVFLPGEEPSPELFHGREFELGLRVAVDNVAPGYFGTLRIPLEAGRDFSAGDRRGAVGVAIVNREFALRLLPGRDAVGQRISWPAWSGPPREPLLIVGIAADSRVRSLTERVPPLLYVPIAQEYNGRATFIVRSADPSQALQDARHVLSRLEPALPLYDAQTMAEHVAASVWQQRMAAEWVIAFGVAALGLCTLGLYGVVAQSTSNRTREISVRLALGATAAGVTGLVVRDGMRVAAVGLAAGLAMFLAMRGLVAGLVEGVGSFGAGDL
ncbi:MAG: ADOP family duplicated permease, partial [Gemmatimonadales bacterium]